MKKILCLFIALTTLILTACGSGTVLTEDETATATVETAENKEEALKGSFAVGFAREKFNPQSPVPLGGFGGFEQRLSKKILDDVCATCIAVKDENENKALIFTLDLCLITDDVSDSGRKMLSNKFGIPIENIILACTHTHSAPAVYSTSSAGQTWLASIFYKSLRTAAQNALDDLDKTEIYQGDVKLENLNFVRRYLNSKGKWMQDSADGIAVQHESEVDNTMQIIKFDRENAKDIVMVNWQAHPTFNDGETRPDVSADYPHNLRKNIEKEGYLCGFWQGAAGNINCGSKLAEEQKYNFNDAATYAKKLSDAVLETLPSLEKVSSGIIKSKEKTVTLTVDHTKDALADKGKQVVDLINAGKLDEARELFPKLGFVNLYQGRDIYNKSRKGATVDQKIAVVSFGDLAFVAAPYEMFDTNGMQIKDASPFKMTFICELANGWDSYYPSELAFDHGGYEVTSFYYVKGTSEMVTNKFIDMLNEVSK